MLRAPSFYNEEWGLYTQKDVIYDYFNNEKYFEYVSLFTYIERDIRYIENIPDSYKLYYVHTIKNPTYFISGRYILSQIGLWK